MTRVTDTHIKKGQKVSIVSIENTSKNFGLLSSMREIFDTREIHTVHEVVKINNSDGEVAVKLSTDPLCLWHPYDLKVENDVDKKEQIFQFDSSQLEKKD